MIIIPSVIESVTTVETVSAGQVCRTVGGSYRKSDFIKHFNTFLCPMMENKISLHFPDGII